MFLPFPLCYLWTQCSKVYRMYLGCFLIWERCTVSNFVKWLDLISPFACSFLPHNQDRTLLLLQCWNKVSNYQRCYHREALRAKAQDKFITYNNHVPGKSQAWQWCCDVVCSSFFLNPPFLCPSLLPDKQPLFTSCSLVLALLHQILYVWRVTMAETHDE